MSKKIISVKYKLHKNINKYISRHLQYCSAKIENFDSFVKKSTKVTYQNEQKKSFKTSQNIFEEFENNCPLCNQLLHIFE